MTTLSEFNEAAADLIAAVEANEAAADHRYAKVMDALDELIEAATACVENGGQLVSPGLASARVDRLRAVLARCKELSA